MQPSCLQCCSRNACCRNSFLKMVSKSTINGRYNRSILQCIREKPCHESGREDLHLSKLAKDGDSLFACNICHLILQRRSTSVCTQVLSPVGIQEYICNCNHSPSSQRWNHRTGIHISVSNLTMSTANSKI